MRLKPHQQKGFTILELAIASMVFTTILLLVTYGLVTIGRAYTKSINESRTQETARAIIDDISRSIQFSGEQVTGPDLRATYPNNQELFQLCIGKRQYIYRTGRVHEVDTPGEQTMIVGDAAGCPSRDASHLSSPPAGFTELLGKRMSLDTLEVVELPSNPNFYRIRVKLLYGDNDTTYGVFNTRDAGAPDRRCEYDKIGIQFCAVTELETIVQKRIE